MNTEDSEFERIEREQALDKMANNAKELGLDYELPLYTFKQPSEPVFALMNMKPRHNITFHNGGKQIGALDFNGLEMVFEGDADESAKVFFDYIAKSFTARLDQERADEREACANYVDHILKEGGGTYGDAIRTRGNT